MTVPPSSRAPTRTSSAPTERLPRDRYEPAEIEPVWRLRWKNARLFDVTDPVTPEERANKYYVLEMLPYPSGRIHMGHVRNYSIGDVLARFHRMRGKHVLHPMGWDSFGMPAENAAIERGRHPADWTLENIAMMRSQLEPLGFSYDWTREVSTCEPEYYRWEQLVFTRMLRAGLAYRKKAIANWCPRCETVLANEQVEDGRCWRCGSEVEKRELDQWFLRITRYADELLEGLDTLRGGWPEQVLTMQRNWIGRSQGARVRFSVSEQDALLHPGLAERDLRYVDVFTTRPDTLYGVTFVSVAPEHPLARVAAAEKSDRGRAVATFLEAMSKKTDIERSAEDAPKEGIDTGVRLVHPLTGERLPVYVASFVLAGYGTGAVMGVPAHDQRDFLFARQHALPIRVVIQPSDMPALPPDGDGMTEAFTAGGRMFDSDDLTGMPSDEGKRAVAERLVARGLGEETMSYRLRDWLISRQRYWGCPIPVVYGDDGAVLPVPDDQLPVVLPRDVVFTGQGGSPLAKHAAFVHAADPRDPSRQAKRETDTFDTFWESSWYFLRYCSKSDTAPFDPEIAAAWMPADQYIGGIEHAVMHLLYARFFHKVLIDLGFLPAGASREPFARLLTQGMVCMQTAFTRDAKGAPVWHYPEEVDDQGRSKLNGEPVQLGRVEKMSKTKKNVVDPDAMIARFGADTMRLFVLFASPPDTELMWSEAGIEGAHRFLSRVYRVVRDALALPRVSSLGLSHGASATSPESIALRRKLHQTIQRVTHDIEDRHQFNTAIAAMMELVNELVPATARAGSRDVPRGLPLAIRESIEALVHLLSPFAPHLADELWRAIRGTAIDEATHERGEGYEFLLDARWPAFDPDVAREDDIEIGVQVNGRVRGRIRIARDADEATALAAGLGEPGVAQHVVGKTPKKVVYVAGRILNLIF